MIVLNFLVSVQFDIWVYGFAFLYFGKVLDFLSLGKGFAVPSYLWKGLLLCLPIINRCFAVPSYH